jgi:hypothetical protein
MPQSIITRYYGPTNTRGSRIVAQTTSGKRKSMGYRHELNGSDNHLEAAKALAQSLNWYGKFQGGALDDKGAMVWVFVDHAFSPDYRFTVLPK